MRLDATGWRRCRTSPWPIARPARSTVCCDSEIISLRLRPGEKLSESDLAARFGTSRAPVREALIRLVEDGLIDVRPQRGSFVSRISLRAMERARFVREALEVADHPARGAAGPFGRGPFRS